MKNNKVRSILTVLLTLFILNGTAESNFLPVVKAGGVGYQPQIGIMAYTDTGGYIDLNYAKSLLKVVNVDDPEEIEGIYSFYTDNYNTEDVNVYITSDGFIAVFYTGADPASRIISWTGDKTISSKFATAISYIGQSLGINIDYANIKYYDYQYPGASRILIATQSVGESTVGTYSYGNLGFNIPSSTTVYEVSYSFYLNDVYDGQNGANIAIDTDAVDNKMYNGINYNFYGGYISTGTDHLLGIMSGPYAQAGVAMIIVYNGPTINVNNAENYFDFASDNPEGATSYNPPTYTPTYTYEPTSISTPVTTPRITVPMPTAIVTSVQNTPVQTAQVPLKPKKASIDLHGERTNVEMGQQVLLKGSIVSFNTNANKMHAQVIIIPPSGFSVSSADFVKSPAGQYTSDFELDPGKGKDIEVTIIPNEPGEFNVVSKITYYFGEDKNTGEYEEAKLPIKVREKGTGSGTGGQDARTGDTPGSPGFDIIYGIGIFIISYLYLKKKK